MASRRSLLQGVSWYISLISTSEQGVDCTSIDHFHAVLRAHMMAITPSTTGMVQAWVAHNVTPITLSQADFLVLFYIW